VIRKKNGGNVSARRAGLQEANGEYVTFMDSDDWLSEDTYEILMQTAVNKKCDIVSFGGYITYDGMKYCTYQDATVFGIFEKGKNLDTFLSKMLYDEEKKTRGIVPALWCKVIKKAIITQAMQDIDENIVVGGDASAFYPCCLLAEKICVIDEYKNYYRTRSGSVCHSYNTSYFDKVYVLYKYLMNIFQKEDEKYKLVMQLRKYIWVFLGGQIKQLYDIWALYDIKTVYLFPYKQVEKNCKIILYGAGKVGQSYNEQISKNGYCEIVAWADKENCKNNNELIAPEQIAELDFSKIVIAIKDRVRAEEIMSELMALGINREKLIWEEPVPMSQM